MRLALGRWVIYMMVRVIYEVGIGKMGNYMMVRVIYEVGIGKMGNLYDGTCDI